MPTLNGFFSISSGPGYVPKYKRAGYLDLQKKSKSKPHGEQCIGGSGGKPIFHPPIYPESVKFLKLVERVTVKTIVKTARPVTKTVCPFTTTTVIPVTSTSTITVLSADVTSTVTATASTAITSTTGFTTTTITITSTIVTSQVPTVTVYLACAENNVVLIANGGVVISNVDTSFAKIAIASGGNGGDALACCNACQATSFCLETLSSAQEGFCFLLTTKDKPQQCNTGQFYGDAFYTNPNPSFKFTVSNGPCGAIADGSSAV